MSLLDPQKVGHTPMGMRIGRSTLIKLVNEQLRRQGKAEIPENSQVVFKVPGVVFTVPGGGDWSSEYVDLDDAEQVIDLRWKA